MNEKKASDEKREGSRDIDEDHQYKNNKSSFSKMGVDELISHKLDKIYEKQFLSTKPSIDETMALPHAAMFTVFLSWKAYKRIVGYAMRYAGDRLKKENWREVYGILIGMVQDNKKVIVKDAIPICVGGNIRVEFEYIHYGDVADINESLYEKDLVDKKEYFIVGWWHTHPGFGFFFSAIDRETQLGYQDKNPYAIGLIFDHCEKKGDFLGIRALRLMDTSKGIASDKDIVEIEYELNTKEMKEKINEVIELIFKNIDVVIDEIKYIEISLLKKSLPQLQKKYGLLIGPESEIKGVVDDEDPFMDEGKLYLWYEEAFTKSYTKPKLKLRLEKELEKSKRILNNLRNAQLTEKYEERKKKLLDKINSIITKPNKMLVQIMDDFFKRKEKIDIFYDFLDTSERKVIENFEGWITAYFKVLDSFKIAMTNF